VEKKMRGPAKGTRWGRILSLACNRDDRALGGKRLKKKADQGHGVRRSGGIVALWSSYRPMENEVRRPVEADWKKN